MAYHPSPRPRGVYRTQDFCSGWVVYRFFDQAGECFIEARVRPDKATDAFDEEQRDRLDRLDPLPAPTGTERFLRLASWAVAAILLVA